VKSPAKFNFVSEPFAAKKAAVSACQKTEHFCADHGQVNVDEVNDEVRYWHHVPMFFQGCFVYARDILCRFTCPQYCGSAIVFAGFGLGSGFGSGFESGSVLFMKNTYELQIF
jgi:hypothetical protein